VACPFCDTLHVKQDLPDGAKASCRLCHAVLLTQQPTALARVLSLALTAFVLMLAAISFPFLDLDVGGQHNATSCLLYTSPSPRDRTRSRMPSSA